MGFDKNVTIILVFLIIFLIGFMKANETLLKCK